MKRILFYLLVTFGLFAFQPQTDDDCEFNLQTHEDWEQKITGESFPFDFIEKRSYLPEWDTISLSKEELYHKSTMSNTFYYACPNDTDSKKIELTLEEIVFNTPCSAFEEFQNAFFYFHTKWPQYEKSTRPCVYLIQNNKLFVISTQPGQEKLMENYVESFLKVLLVNSSQQGSLFVRYTGAKAVLK